MIEFRLIGIKFEFDFSLDLLKGFKDNIDMKYQ